MRRACRIAGITLWAAAQRMIAPRYRDHLVALMRARFDVSRPGLWLDVGCGPRSMAESVLPGVIVGVDVSLVALAAAGARTVHVCARAEALPFPSATFDGVMSFGLLHHLDDARASRVLDEMRRVARARAPVLVFDAVLPRSRWRHPLATLLRRADRGAYMRDSVALRGLLGRAGFGVGPIAVYAWTGLEGCAADAGSDSVEATRARR